MYSKAERQRIVTGNTVYNYFCITMTFMRQIGIIFLWLFLSCSDTAKEDKTGKENISYEQTLKNALAQYPDSLPLLDNLLQHYGETENYDSALSAINRAIYRDSINPGLYDMQSMILVAKGDTSGAVLSLEKAILIYPAPPYIISLGALYAQTRNPLALEMSDALLIGNKAAAEKEAYFIKGLYYSFKEQKEKAIPFFDQAIQKDFQFMAAYLEKGLALYDIKKYKESADVFTRAVTLQNNFDRGYYYLGRSLEKLNRPAEAREAYEKALMYDPNYTEAKEALDRSGG